MIEINSGSELERAVVRVGKALGLEVETQVVMGDRIWGPRRHVDVVLSKTDSERIIGIECKYQRQSGSVEEKIPLTVEDIEDWPIRGIVVIHGEGFSRDFVPFLRGRGRIVEFKRLAEWLRFYFRLSRERALQAEMLLNGDGYLCRSKSRLARGIVPTNATRMRASSRAPS